MMALKNIIFIVAAFALQICQLCNALQEFNLTSGTVENLVLPNHKFVALSLYNVTNGTTYMLQLHSQIYNMTLCKSPIMTHTSCKNGTNIGLYIQTPSVVESDSIVMWYVRMDSNISNTTVVSYPDYFYIGAPIPGGCNEVFNLERDASIELSYYPHRVRIFFQWANEQVLGTVPDCDSDWVLSDLEYEFYVYFLDGDSLGQQAYLEGVSKMMRIGDIQNHGQKIETIQNKATIKPEILVASESSRGAIFSIVVRSKNSGLSSAYVTAVTYSCNFVLNTCDTSLSRGDIIITIICFLVGLFMLLLGHRMFHLSQFLFGYLLTFFLTFLLMSMANTIIQRSVVLGISGCIAVIGGGLCLVFWYFCFFPIASVLIPGLCAGYLVAATLFFTPFGRIVWWESNENYILAFICAVLVYAVFLMAFSKFLSIFSSSLVGSYLVLMVVAIPLRSSLRLIYLYTEYRQTDKNFAKVKPVGPMKTIDIILLTFWPVVMILGMLFQYYRERGRPAFERFDLRWKLPNIRKRHISPDGEVDPLYETDTEYDSDDPSERSRIMPTPTERSPLLRGAVGPSPNIPSPVVKNEANTNPSYDAIQNSQEVPRSMREIC